MPRKTNFLKIKKKEQKKKIQFSSSKTIFPKTFTGVKTIVPSNFSSQL